MDDTDGLTVGSLTPPQSPLAVTADELVDELADDNKHAGEKSSLAAPARKASSDSGSNLSLSESVKQDRRDQKRPLVEQEAQGRASSGGVQEKELLALKEVLGVLRRTGMSVQQLIGVLVGDGDGKGAEEGQGEKGAAAEVTIQPGGKTVSKADDDDAAIPEDPELDWNAGKLALLSLPQLHRRVKASFRYAEASEENMALEWERLEILGRVIGAKEKAAEKAEEEERVLAGRQGRLEDKALGILKFGIAKGRGEYVKATKEKKGFFKAIEDVRDLNHLQRKEIKTATSEKTKAASEAAKRWVKEDGYEVLKAASGLTGTFAGSAVKAMMS